MGEEYQATQAELLQAGVAGKKPGATRHLTANLPRLRQRRVVATKTSPAANRPQMMNGFGYLDRWHVTWDTWIRPAITL